MASDKQPRDRTQPPPAAVTDAELAVLKVLWEREPAAIRDLAAVLYPGGGASEYATVQKLLERLESKGCVARRPAGRANLYRTLVARDDLIDRSLRRTADKLCEGSLTPLLTRLVESTPVDPRTLHELRELVDRLERERGDGS